MKYLIFTNTPAHVHLYRNAVVELQSRGHEVLVLARDYGCTLDLLEYYGLPHSVYGKLATSKSSLARQLPNHYLNIFREARRFDPDRIFGVGAYAAHAGALTGASVVLITDSENTHLDHAISKPFADAYLTPHTFDKDLGEKHHVFRGFKECAYLHPEEFTPQTEIRERLGVGESEAFTIVRLNAFGSHHDVGEQGFTPEKRRELVEQLAADATVFVSDEGGDMDFSAVPARPFDLHPALLHDALDEASLLVADTQTMVTEAALLGTPAVRSNSFVGEDDMGNFLELEREGLIYNVKEFDAVIDRATDLLAREGTDREWARKREAFLADKVNLTDLVVSVATDPTMLETLPTKQTDGRSPAEASADAF
jgi:predicted glycosyltransferase